MSESPISLLIDENGNIIASTLDGSTYRLNVDAKISNQPIVDINSLPVLNINNIAGTISLPTGASTETKQDSTILELQNIGTDVELSNTKLDQILNDIANGTKSIIRDGTDSSYLAKVDGSGNQYFVTPTPSAPVGKTSIEDTQQNNVNSIHNSFTIIPLGETIVIQRLKGGCEYDNAGSKIELFYAPNGNTTGITLIDTLYTNGNSDHSDLHYPTDIGNGTNAILLRRSRLSGGAVEIFGKWEGYY